MPKKIYITNDKLQSIKCNNTAVKKLRQFTKNFRTRSYHNSTSAVDYANAASNSTNFSCYSRTLDEQFTNQQHATNVKKGKKPAVLVGRVAVPITSQMIRVAVKQLQTRRAYISSSLISKHLQKSYPIESDPNALKDELYEKLNCAVCVGLIAKCGDDKYCIPTLRQQATNLNKSAVTAFWDTYYGSSIPSTMRKFSTLGALRVRANKKRRDITPNRNSGSGSKNFEYLERKAT